MRKMAIRLFMSAICATALVAVPMVVALVAPAKAATDSKEIRKNKKTHRSLRIERPKSSNQAQPYSNPNDDFDRKASY